MMSCILVFYLACSWGVGLELPVAQSPADPDALYAARAFLAETLIDMKRTSEATVILDRLIAADINPAWAAEDREFKAKAQQLMRTLR